jgi:hypothetical protein
MELATPNCYSGREKLDHFVGFRVLRHRLERSLALDLVLANEP